MVSARLLRARRPILTFPPFVRRCVLLGALLTSPAIAADAWTVFRIPEAQMDFPVAWRVLNGQEQLTLQAWVETISKDSATAHHASKQRVLLHAIAPSGLGYAYVRIVRNPKDELVAQTASRAASTKQLREEDAKYRTSLEPTISAAGQRIVQWTNLHRTEIAGREAVVTSYVRSGPSGDVYSEYFQVPADNAMFGVGFAYRRSEESLWKPIVDRMRGSLVFK